MCYSSLCVCVCVFWGEGRGGGISTKKGKTLQSTSQLGICMFLFQFSNVNFFFFLKFLMQLFQQHFNQKGEDIAKYQLARYMHVFIFFFTCEFFFFLKFLMQLFQQQLYIYYYFSHLYTSITICQPRNSFSSLI